MNFTDRSRLKDFIGNLEEEETWALLVEFFIDQGIKAVKVHSSGEHGIDVIASVEPDQDKLLGTGYSILIQAKKGNLRLGDWRRDVLGQLLEASYYQISHPYYQINKARRVLLVLSGVATHEVQNAIRMFNQKHAITIEMWELDDIVRNFSSSGFGQRILERITGVGQPTEPIDVPPAVGEEPITK